MLLSYKTTVAISADYANIIGHMCYAAYKLWNVCNYERKNYKDLSLPVEYPDWYYQKQAHKDDLWFKQLPSQTAQEVCKLLDKSWKSFYKLLETGGIAHPNPPKFKHENMVITYMQNGIVHNKENGTVRLSLSKSLKEFMSNTYGINETYLYLENKLFKDVNTIKQIKLYPPADGACDVIIIYEVDEPEMLPDNGRYLSIDIGLHNLMTCYDSMTGTTFIIGRKYLSICRYYNKCIAEKQSEWARIQYDNGIEYPKMSKRVRRLYKKKADVINDYLHKVTRYIVNYCKENHIHTVVIGDITNIRKENDLGAVTNQKLHALPYKRIYMQLEYKLKMSGIHFVLQTEEYSSQTSPYSPNVSKKYACKENRVMRGLYRDKGTEWNADCVGAFNILRLYSQKVKSDIQLNPDNLCHPYIVKVAV